MSTWLCQDDCQDNCQDDCQDDRAFPLHCNLPEGSMSNEPRDGCSPGPVLLSFSWCEDKKKDVSSDKLTEISNQTSQNTNQ